MLETSPDKVTVTAWGPGSEWAINNAGDLIGLNDEAPDMAAPDPVVGRLLRSMTGLRMCRTQAVMECLVPTILEQKVTGAEAARSYRDLVKEFSDPAPGPAGLTLPPDPARLARLPYYELHRFGVERKRADIIRGACSVAPRLEEVVSMDRAEGERRLGSVPGIGPWTIGHVARTALGDPDAVDSVTSTSHISWPTRSPARGAPPTSACWSSSSPTRASTGRVQQMIAIGGAAPRATGTADALARRGSYLRCRAGPSSSRAHIVRAPRGPAGC